MNMLIKTFIMALVLAVGLSGCEAQGASPEHPIYYQCAR